MIYLDKLQTKLNAILAKDVDAIYAQHPYLPILGNTYTKTQLKNWLNKVAKILSDSKGFTEAQVIAYKNTTYNSLTTAQKATINNAIAGNPEDLTKYGSAVYDKFIILLLINHITTP